MKPDKDWKPTKCIDCADPINQDPDPDSGVTIWCKVCRSWFGQISPIPAAYLGIPSKNGMEIGADGRWKGSK
jgi:hypothetical protein